MALSVHSFLFKPVLNIPTRKLAPPTSVISSKSILELLKAEKLKHTKCHAVTDLRSTVSSVEDDHKVLVGPSSEEERRGERLVADYDWTEEWYPLYLTKDVPDDAPLGLTVFDQQIVLYKDGNGVLRCFQDRCPHR